MQQYSDKNLKKEHSQGDSEYSISNSQVDNSETQNINLDGSFRQNRNQLEIKDALNDSKIHYNNQFEEQLLDKILREEPSTDLIFQELLDSLNKLKLTVKDKNEEQILNIRIQQLSISKILVLAHKKTDFLLVVAHTHIGQSYLNFKCYQQAIGHLQIALKKIKKVYFSKIEQQKKTKNSEFYKQLGFGLLTYRSLIYTLLGKCQFETQRLPEAIEYLEKATKCQEAKTNQDQVVSTTTLIYLAHCYAKLKQYKKAISFMDDVLQILNIYPNQNSTKIALTLIQKSKIFALQNQFLNAQLAIQKAITIFDQNQTQQLQFIAQMYGILARYQQKLSDKDGQQNSLKKIKRIFQILYSPYDQKILAMRNQIAHFYLKNGKHTQALQQLNQTLDLQQHAYGYESIQVANTLKSIGNIYKKINKPQRAQSVLKKAKAISINHKAYNNNRNHFKHTKDIKDKRSTQKSKTLKEKKNIQ